MGANAPSAATSEQGTASGARTGPAGGVWGGSSSESYKIGVRDIIEITVFKVPELTKTVEVADTGTVNLPLLGEVAVAGKTAQQVERDLASRLGQEYLQNPQVTVYVKQNNSQTVIISGAIQKPGVYPLSGKTSLLEMVVTAGYFNPDSDSTVLILRKKGGKRYAAKFDVSAIQNGKAQDPALQPGDQIVAGTSAIKRAYGTIMKVLPLAGAFALL